MGKWLEALDAKAAIIHDQLAAAKLLARAHGREEALVAQPYLKLLRTLYENEFEFSRIADSSDLVARFTGPAVAGHDLPVDLVRKAVKDLRDQIRRIANAIVGLSGAKPVRWPSVLEPQLSGVMHGSLVVGLSLPPQRESDSGQVDEPVHAAMRAAMQNLAAVGRCLEGDKLSDTVVEEFPNPAVRQAVLAAACRLAPSGRQGIDSVSLFNANQRTGRPPGLLTPASRRVLSQSLQRQAKAPRNGAFEGVVREMDLDARRFKLCRVRGKGAIRCTYGPEQDPGIADILGSWVRVSGQYETAKDGRPRLLAASSIEPIKPTAAR